jgi:hypothetical protein
MSNPNPGDALLPEPSDFDSRDCLIIIDEGPADTTVRPSRPLLRQLGEMFQKLLAEREKQPPPAEPNERR